MAGSRLAVQEQRDLEEIERALSRDRRLDRRLRTFSLPPRRPRVRTTMSLLALSVTLTVTGIVTSEPGVIPAFAVVWPVTLCTLFRLLCRCASG
ncbi:DUF3040 domain-containing protein [Streptomyces phaeoluteigriseus]|uniref:DUF3040 domain-containing protein n=1 Tax=Streptomyces phaeoluteigriseus TaxID=114686 RepID=UPI0036C20331